MNEDQSAVEVWQYIKEGPDAGGDRLAMRMVGFLAWWWTWAMTIIILGSLVLLASVEPRTYDPRMWGYIVGIFTAGAVEKVSSDKYGF